MRRYSPESEQCCNTTKEGLISVKGTAMGNSPRPARSVLFLQVKPGMRDALIDVFRRLDIPGHALQQAGCLSVEVQTPPDADGPVLVTALWTHREAYEGWLANPWREYSGNEIAPFLDGESSGVVYDVALAEGDVSAVAAGAPKVSDPR
jgi:quinol monooxygenase YgiN